MTPRCSLCNRKEGRDKEFGYPVGYYETELRIGGRLSTFMVCSKCNRCILKDVNERLQSDEWKRKRVVKFKGSSKEGSTSA